MLSTLAGAGSDGSSDPSTAAENWSAGHGDGEVHLLDAAMQLLTRLVDMAGTAG